MSDHRYLLDTNIVSGLVRHPQAEFARRIARVGEAQVCTSVIVACELQFGAAKKGSSRLSAQLNQVLSALPILPLPPNAAVIYGDIRSALERAGCPIGANDLLIASHAMALGLVLVTDNTREFERIAGLQIENWLDRP